MPIPDYSSYNLAMYADVTIVLELLSNAVPSTLPSAANELIDWFQSNELHVILNVGKTKEQIIRNMRDNPTCDSLVINITAVK